MHAGVYPIGATLAALKKLTPQLLQAFVDNALFDSARVEALLIGNVATDTAQAMAQDLRETLTTRGSAPLEAAEMDHYRLVAIPRGEPVSVHMNVRNNEEQNSAHITVFQMHEQGSAKISALTDLTDQLMHRQGPALVSQLLFAHPDLVYRLGTQLRFNHLLVCTTEQEK